MMPKAVISRPTMRSLGSMSIGRSGAGCAATCLVRALTRSLIWINAMWSRRCDAVMRGRCWRLCVRCTSLPLGGGLLLGLFLAGAAGSTMHCVPMCGGFVLGQVADRMARLPAARLCEWRRMRSGVLLPYHLGRLTTYAGLGVRRWGRLPWFGSLLRRCCCSARPLFLAHALRRLVPARRACLPGLDARRRVEPAGRRRLAAPGRSGDGYLLGVALGFLPCGFLYAALAAAGGRAAARCSGRWGCWRSGWAPRRR